MKTRSSTRKDQRRAADAMILLRLRYEYEEETDPVQKVIRFKKRLEELTFLDIYLTRLWLLECS